MFVQRFEPQGRRFVDISFIIIIIVVIIIIIIVGIIIIFISSIKLYTFRPVTYYEYPR